MLKWLMRKGLASFERKWNYDASYMRELIDADPMAAWNFSKAAAIGTYRKDLPLAAWTAAALTAVRHEDCGPCTQLGVQMAETSGVDPKVLRAILAEDAAAMPDDVVLAWRFTRAALDHDPTVDEYRTGDRPVLGPARGHQPGLRDGGVAHVSDGEIRHGARPVLPADRRRRHARGAEPARAAVAARMTIDPSTSFEPPPAPPRPGLPDARARWPKPRTPCRRPTCAGTHADCDAVAEPRAFLTTMMTRICLDVLKSARVRREEYVGPWLPDPVMDTTALAPDAETEIAEDSSVALLLALDELSPLERAAFLLHDVFDYSFTQVADALGPQRGGLPPAGEPRADARPRSAAGRCRGRRAGALQPGRPEARGDLSAFLAASRFRATSRR